MSARTWYVTLVTLAAVVASAPFVLLFGLIAAECVMRGKFTMPTLPGFDGPAYHNPLQELAFWRNRLVHFRDFESDHMGNRQRKIALVDPETGELTKLDTKLEGTGWFRTFVFGDRLFFFGDKSAFELIDNTIQSAPYRRPVSSQFNNEFLIWKNRPAVVKDVNGDWTLLSLQEEGWQTIGRLDIPQNHGELSIDGHKVGLEGPSQIRIVESENTHHLFVANSGRLFYREGLPIKPLAKSLVSDPAAPASQTADSIESSPENESAMEWTMVRDAPAEGIGGISRVHHGLLIGGKPAALIIDDVATGNAFGRLYQFEGARWSEFASMRFPFGSTSFVGVTRDDGECSYVGISTSTGESYFYALDKTGIRPTSGSPVTKIREYDGLVNSAVDALRFYEFVIAILVPVGLLLGLVVWFLMYCFTKPDYEFGMQRVQLASLGWRGCATLVDLGIFAVSTIGLVWVLLYDFDWLALAEALNMHVPHPTITRAKYTGTILVAWLATLTILMLWWQARWGVTPGKWLCRLRTVRTSLRPCGFASSLARGIVFFVDCGNFLFWTPGIVSVALTERRQRLGDLLADTIVVNASSLDAVSHKTDDPISTANQMQSSH